MDPITRKETFLAKAGGQDVTTPTPVTREEYFLNEIAKNGGGSGGAEPLILSITDSNIFGGGTKHEVDKTAGEIYTAFMSGKQIFLDLDPGNSTEELFPVLMLKVDNGYVDKFYINKTVLNAEFIANAATTKPYYITSSGGGND